MQIRDPVSRWLMKRLHTGFDASGMAVQEMAATEIRRDSGLPEWRTTRNLLARISRAVDLLATKGLLDQAEALPVMQGRVKSDIIYTMVLSPSFMSEVVASRRRARENAENFERLAATTGSAEFAVVDAATAYRLRRNGATATARA